MILILLLISLSAFSQVSTKTHFIKYKAYLLTDSTDIAFAINKQVNYSLGPATTLKKIGHNSSLTEKFNYEIISKTLHESGLTKVEYTYIGKLLTEQYVDIETYKVVLPLNTETIYKKANRKCASRSGENLFYQSWSPKYRRCPLKKGSDYEEFKVEFIGEMDSKHELIKDDLRNEGKYKLFFYFGSDYHSTRKFGHAQKGYDQTLKALKKKGFIKRFDNIQKQEIFNKISLFSRYQKLTGKIDGIETEVYLLLGNPDSKTPKAQYEFFRFFKYAFKNASAINYNGHAGLGENLNFDKLEVKFKEKITYNQNQKQLYLLSGCSTYLQSSGFFFSKKKQKNSLILITNGLSVKLRVNKFLPQAILNSLSFKDSMTSDSLRVEIYKQMKRAGASKSQFPMTAVEFN